MAKPLHMRGGAHSLPNEEKTIKEKKSFPRKDIVLIEFKAPRELLEAFDLKLRPRFSNRSEAIRYLIRMFVDEAPRMPERISM